jgi:NTE family protein
MKKLALYYLEVVPEELHLGILKALEEFGIVPSHISGTSAGDNRCLYAAGYSIPEIVNILKKGGYLIFLY